MPTPDRLPVPIAAADAAPTGGKMLWSIQYLRAAAAFGVIAFHALSDSGHDFPFGAVGIHLFFTISGFLMWTTTCAAPANVPRFVRSRIARIVPLYWLATAATLALSTHFDGFFYQATLAPVHVAKSLLFIPQIGIEGGLFPVLYQGWTLQYEMFFYALFALALTRPPRQRLWWLTAVLGACSAWGLAWPGAKNPLVATYTDPICLEFLLGAWAGWWCAGRQTPPRLGALLLASGAILLRLGYLHLGTIRWASWLVVGGAAAALLVGAVSLERAARLPRWRWLRYAGEASYSLYLFQELGFLVASLCGNRWPALAGPLAKAAAGCVGAVVVGIAIYAAIETPLQRLLRPRKRASPFSA